MTTVGFCHPLVPPEWIAAHAVEPRWLRGRLSSRRRFTGRSLCPYAGALLDAVPGGLGVDALVLTTTCDQIRHAASLLQSDGRLPVFLLNVPATRQAAAQRLYVDELQRLGQFLVELGGTPAGETALSASMMVYDSARARLLARRDRLSARQFAQALADVRGSRPQGSGDPHSRDGAPLQESDGSVRRVRLAMVGGPLLEDHEVVLDAVERAGGRVVLDATEGGERCLPRPFCPQALRRDGLAELARAYFAIPDVFQRPNGALYQWLEQELAARAVRGILFHRYVWCDLWHAEYAPLKSRVSIPVIEIDECDGEPSCRTGTRIEALLETLR